MLLGQRGDVNSLCGLNMQLRLWKQIANMSCIHIGQKSPKHHLLCSLPHRSSCTHPLSYSVAFVKGTCIFLLVYITAEKKKNSAWIPFLTDQDMTLIYVMLHCAQHRMTGLVIVLCVNVDFKRHTILSCRVWFLQLLTALTMQMCLRRSVKNSDAGINISRRQKTW